MDKKRADMIIEDYTKPMYAFALRKMGNLGEAEELAGRIIVEVYQVLCSRDDFIDLNSYVYKVAHNIWTKFLQEKTRKKGELALQESGFEYNDYRVDKQYIDQETEGILRREIAYLSAQQREIIVAYYYKKMKIREIAEQMDLSEGTIKWNLFEAKKELKTGMKAIRTIGNLGINPIQFEYMGHNGVPGEKGDTKDFLGKIITQNIAYAAYHKPRSIHEIAEELGISPIFVEDEVATLEEYGFMEVLPGGKYRTHMVIMEPALEDRAVLHEFNEQYAKRLYELYYKELLGLEEKMKAIGIYYPNGDFNQLLWSLVPYANELMNFSEDHAIAIDEVAIHRKDGGYYIAIGSIQKAMDIPIQEAVYNAMYMKRADGEEWHIKGFQAAAYWSGREPEWRDNKYSDYVSMAHFIDGKLIENEVTEEIYSRLLEKEYLVKMDDGYKVNIVYMKGKEQIEAFRAAFPKPSEEVRRLVKELDEKAYQMKKIGHPVHMHKTIKYLSQGRINVLWPYIFVEMLERGVLKEPTKEQQKGISTVLFMK